MQLVGDQCELTFSLCLGAIAALPIVSAKLFELVVQAFHGVGLTVR